MDHFIVGDPEDKKDGSQHAHGRTMMKMTTRWKRMTSSRPAI